MNILSLTRQKVIESINNLPEESFSELMSFIAYLNFKSHQKEIEQEKQPTNFLLAIAGLGTSGENHISEQDEEILSTEIDPINGWDLKSGDVNDSNS